MLVIDAAGTEGVEFNVVAKGVHVLVCEVLFQAL